MAFRAVHVSDDPLTYFLQQGDEGPYLRVSDVVIRYNHGKDVFSELIRVATDSKWSHSALLYLLSDPPKGFDNTFLIEAWNTGIRVASWRNEVVPFEKFTVGIKRLRLDWYVETPYEISHHEPTDLEDTHGISYLRHVRGMALDQINELYDHKVIYEITALYLKRVAKRRLGAVPQVAEAADALANHFKKWEESEDRKTNVLRFICSGLVQYSFFWALRRRIINDLAIPEHREVAMSNLSNLHRIIFREDPEGVIPRYIQQIQSGKLNIADPVPEDVQDLVKTAVPADFNNSPNLEWRYILLKGVIWEIHEAPPDYKPQSKEETEVLELLTPEHRS